ncbi:MAG: cation-translocating P-type ATPase [Burkholderiaceae bacterium]
MPAPDVTPAPSCQSIDELIRTQQTNQDQGLSGAQAIARLERDGPNQLRLAAPVPVWKKLLLQLHSPVVYLLLVAVAIALVAWIVEGAHGLPIDVIVIVAILLLNALLGYAQEAKADRAVAALKRLTRASSLVLRDGLQTQIPSEDLVRGDILLLNEGDSVGADARLIQVNGLHTAEAALTGESESVLKDAEARSEVAPLAEQRNMVFKGTGVSQGNAVAVVTATGMQTQIGQIANLLEQTTDDPTPLQIEVARVSKMLASVVVAVALIVVSTLLFLNAGRGTEQLIATLLLGVSLAVAAVPEGLPAILSIVLALGVQRMAGKQAIIKRLSSVETLGSASVICTDKTGTLTRAEMTVQKIITASGETEVSGIGYDPVGEVQPLKTQTGTESICREVRLFLGGCSLANNAQLTIDDEQHGQIQGDPTEAAFLVAERKLNDIRFRESRFKRLAEVPFTSTRKRMTVVVSDRELSGQAIVVTKGAPDVLLALCNRVQQGADVIPMSDDLRTRLLADVNRLTGEALRTLALAYRPLAGSFEPTRSDDTELLENDLIYVGVAGLIDPPRLEVGPAISAARSAGIRVLMITGDHPVTAGRIAADLSLADDTQQIMTGPQIAELDDASLTQAIRKTVVFARVEPVHKMRIVDALQADGNVVAMTGDGVNDAPALKAADIGVAMGVTGTEVTKEAADMILADDHFTTIVEAVREGRGIYQNLRKSLRYLLSSNMGEVLAIFLGVIGAAWIGLNGADNAVILPLLATQVLWINLITDSAPALAIALDPVDDEVMKAPPRQINEPMITASVWRDVVQTGLVMALATLLTIDLYLPGGLIEGSQTLDNSRTAGFTVLVFGQLFNCFNARTSTDSALPHLLSNHWLLVAIALSATLQVAVVHLEFLNLAFNTVPLSFTQWGVCVLMASSVLWIAEISKLVRRQMKQR